MTKPYPGPWVFRSMLFVPGHNEKMLSKGANSAADCVVLDLEDAVPEQQKAQAREKIRKCLDDGLFKKKTVFARINPIESGLTLRDLEVVASPALNGFVYPMARTPDDIKSFHAQLSLTEAHLGLDPGHFSVIILIETPLAVLNAFEMAVASDRVVGLLFGCEDYLAEVGARHCDLDMSLHGPRTMVVLAATAAGVEPIDTPYVKVHDTDGLREFATRARDLGMVGMLVMTPRQIDTAHEIYTPSEEEVRFAEEIVEEARKARDQEKGIVVVDGKFVSPPTVRAAKSVLTLHNAIRDLEAFHGS